MRHDILEEAQRLRAERRPFALATVVAAKQPASGTPGARAIVLPGGRIEGWIGGHCAQPTVIRQGLAALADGAPRLVVLRPDAASEGDMPAAMAGRVEVPMLCASEGELHIFVEPFLPKLTLAVVGASPVARTLARLGTLLDFEVWACDADADMRTFPDADRLIIDLDALRPQLTAQCYVVVATMNTYDEDAVYAALASHASYVGVVASQKRFAALRDALAGRDIPADRLTRLNRPLGMPGIPGTAHQPEEIAFRIMAELLELRRQRVGMEVGIEARAEAIDPICGMTVAIATARYTSERDGQTYYFCCKGCQTSFAAS